MTQTIRKATLKQARRNLPCVLSIQLQSRDVEAFYEIEIVWNSDTFLWTCSSTLTQIIKLRAFSYCEISECLVCNNKQIAFAHLLLTSVRWISIYMAHFQRHVYASDYYIALSFQSSNVELVDKTTPSSSKMLKKRMQKL